MAKGGRCLQLMKTSFVWGRCFQMQKKKPWSALCTISNIGHLQCPIDKIYGEGIVGIKVVIDFMVDIGSS
jgi:hypothetical protein